MLHFLSILRVTYDLCLKYGWLVYYSLQVVFQIKFKHQRSSLQTKKEKTPYVDIAILVVGFKISNCSILCSTAWYGVIDEIAQSYCLVIFNFSVSRR